MGGFGSGDQPQHDLRPLVELCHPLRFKLVREALDSDEEWMLGLQLGDQFVMVLTWPDRLQIILDYTIGGVDLQQTIRITSRPQKHGLRRCWECPQCSRAVRVLYRPPAEVTWRCKHCSRMVYWSSRLSDSATRAILKQALDGDESGLQGCSQAALKATVLLERKHLRSSRE